MEKANGLSIRFGAAQADKMISYRGVLCLAVGALFIVLSANRLPNPDTPPFLIRALLGVVGVAMIVAGLALLRKVWRGHWVVTQNAPVQGKVTVLPDPLAEDGARTVNVNLADARWVVATDVSGPSETALDDGVTRDASVWLDPRDGSPAAIEIDGHRLNLIPGKRRIAPAGLGAQG
jgi:hypothetical protein